MLRRAGCRLAAPDFDAAVEKLKGLDGILEFRRVRGGLRVDYNPARVRHRKLRRHLAAPGHAPRRGLRDTLYEYLEQNLLDEASQPPDWEARLRDAYLRLRLLSPTRRRDGEAATPSPASRAARD